MMVSALFQDGSRKTQMHYKGLLQNYCNYLIVYNKLQ